MKMIELRPRIEVALKASGFTLVEQSSYTKWTKGRGNNVWFSKQVFRVLKGTEAADIVRRIAGKPNGSVSEKQQPYQDAWYTDGYRSRGTAAI